MALVYDGVVTLCKLFMDFTLEQSKGRTGKSYYFKYLGTSIEEECDMETEITKLVGPGWIDWKNCNGVGLLCDGRMPAKLKGKQ